MAVGFDGALERARDLKTVLHRHGVGQVSIELSPGRPGTPHNRWYDTRFVGVLSHHIVSHRGMGPTPGLWLVKNGRTDVPGPLANGYGGFDEVYRIICMGWANHPGSGGPWTVPGGTIPRDNGRPYLWGTEYEGGIRESDWTPSFREFMGRSNAAICEWLGVDERSHGEHLTWAPRRKIDRLNYTTGSGRAELRPYLLEDDDMTPEQAKQLETIYKRVSTLFSVVNSYSEDKIARPDADGKTSGMRWALQKVWEDTHDLRTVPDELEALRAGILGSSADEIKALIETKHAEAAAQRQVIADTMTAKLDAIVDATQGADPAEAKLAAILEILGVDA